MPADIALAAADLELANEPGKDFLLHEAISLVENGRRNLHKDAAKEVAKMFKDRLYKTYIRNSVTIAESPGFGQDIFAYKLDSTGAKDFSDLIDEIVKQENNNE